MDDSPPPPDAPELPRLELNKNETTEKAAASHQKN
jgi:hypothetical protein